jgi:RimJ/RimL family protein N-acetyltransferase
MSISLDRKFRGKGYGSSLIRLASQELFEVSDVEVIHASIKEGNEAAIGAFKKAGLTLQEPPERVNIKHIISF